MTISNNSLLSLAASRFSRIAILYGITAAVIIVVVIHIGNNKKLMGANVNGRWSNILGWLTFGLMSIAAVTLFAILTAVTGY